MTRKLRNTLFIVTAVLLAVVAYCHYSGVADCNPMAQGGGQGCEVDR